jgi:hypothetical protein
MFIVGKGVEVSKAHVMFGHIGLHLLMPQSPAAAAPTTVYVKFVF